jgi:hypothetical protein
MEDRNYCSALIKDKNGEIKYSVFGKYTEYLTAVDIETNR